MIAVFLAFGASLGWGGADFLGGSATRRLPVLTVTVFSQVVGFAFVLGLVVVGNEGMPDPRAVTLGLLAGCLGGVGLATLYAALSSTARPLRARRPARGRSPVPSRRRADAA